MRRLPMQLQRGLELLEELPGRAAAFSSSQFQPCKEILNLQYRPDLQHCPTPFAVASQRGCGWRVQIQQGKGVARQLVTAVCILRPHCSRAGAVGGRG